MLQTPQRCFSLASPNDISDNGLLQVSGETSCLFKTSISQPAERYMLPNTLDFPKDMSHRSVLALEIQGFS